MQFNKRLHDLRTEMNLTQKELSAKTGISVSNITKYERGIRLPTIEILVKLAKFFNVTLEFILGVEDEIS